MSVGGGCAPQVQGTHACQRVHLEKTKKGGQDSKKENEAGIGKVLLKPISNMKRLSNEDTCTGEMASRLLVLGARPFGITPGGGCRALFITLLQFATMVRIVSDSSWDTFLRKKVKPIIKSQKI